MPVIWVTMEDAVLAVRRTDRWRAETMLSGATTRCLAIDPSSPQRLYCGTADRGLLRSGDGGTTWQPAGEGIDHGYITAVAVSPNERGDDGSAVVYAGTEPSAVFRSADGGDSWQRRGGLLELPSSTSWSFPPRPDTHHARWIEPDPSSPGRLYVAIEAGALVTYEPGPGSWHDRVPNGPIDTHTLLIDPDDARHLHSAAGDGYFESLDGGATWEQPQDGLDHRYVWSCAVDPDANVVLISSASGPMSAHSAARAESRIYRRAGGSEWQAVNDGLPAARGTTVSSLAAGPGEAGVFYAANNRGVFRSADAGRSWRQLDIEWPERFHEQRVARVVVAPDD